MVDDALGLTVVNPLRTALAVVMSAHKKNLNKSLVVYRLVHAPVTRESGVRLPAREYAFFSCLRRTVYMVTVRSFVHD